MDDFFVKINDIPNWFRERPGGLREISLSGDQVFIPEKIFKHRFVMFTPHQLPCIRTFETIDEVTDEIKRRFPVKVGFLYDQQKEKYLNVRWDIRVEESDET